MSVNLSPDENESHPPWVPGIRQGERPVQRRQDLDLAIIGKLGWSHVGKLLLSPRAHALGLDLDGGLGRGLSDLENLGTDMDVGRGRILSEVRGVEVNGLDG